MTPRGIDLEEKWEYDPISMIQDLMFPVHVDVAPQVEPTICCNTCWSYVVEKLQTKCYYIVHDDAC